VTATDPPAPNAIGSALGLLGDEWTLLIVRALLLGLGGATGARRYGELQSELGIGPTVLAARLATLTEAGVIEKGEGRTGYQLTRSGKDLWALLLCIWAWEQRWVQGEALPVMRHAECGEVFVPVLCCASCDGAVQAADVDVRFGPSGAMSRSVPTGSNRRRSGGGRPEGPGLFPETMALMGSRWSSAVLGAAFLGAARFSEFETMLGAPANVVAERLRTFVALGVLDESYALTAKGLDFFPAVSLLVGWGETWVPAPDGPALVARHRQCAGPFVPVLHCSACGQLVRRTAVAVEARGRRRAS
jgi:DNA-binding HxlR family transcriptional regulator